MRIIRTFRFRAMARALGVAVLWGCCAFLSGCVSQEYVDPMAKSEHGDIPWNQPQAWEGTIPMPGPMGGGY